MSREYAVSDLVDGQHDTFAGFLLCAGMWVLVGVTAVVALVLTVQFQRALYLEGVRGADKWLWLFRGVDLGGMRQRSVCTDSRA